MKDLTLSELVDWINKSEETGYYRGFSRHEIALEYHKRIRYLQSIVPLKK